MNRQMEAGFDNTRHMYLDIMIYYFFKIFKKPI